MTCDQIDDVKDALLDLPIPWFDSESDYGLTGFVGYFLANYRRSSNGVASVSAILLLLMAIFDISDGPIGERPPFRRCFRSRRTIHFAQNTQTKERASLSAQSGGRSSFTYPRGAFQDFGDEFGFP
jgi:hypothetical protein